MAAGSSRDVKFADNIDLGEKGFAYDPDQDHEEKRKVRRGYRALQRNTEDPHSIQNAEELMEQVQQLNSLFNDVKNPQEATLDSAQLLHFSNIGANQARALKSGPSAFDVDDFVSKLLVYMGGARQLAREDGAEASDVELDDGDAPLDWDKIGRRVLGKSRRVPVVDFMLGPLAIEQKKRAQTKRTAKLQKDEREKTKPQEISEEDIQRSENETTKNVAQLERLLEDAGAVNLFKFIVNPDLEKGFAQTVENLFYLSFLIRDGKCALDIHEDTGEPTIYLCEPPSQADYDEGLKKHQHVMELDMATWEDAIELFNITESMIPLRKVQDVSFRGTAKPGEKWYG